MSTTFSTSTPSISKPSTSKPLAARLKQARYYWSPRQTFADLFAKTWMEPAIPFTVLVALLLIFSTVVPNYASAYNASTMGREFAEFGFVAIAHISDGSFVGSTTAVPGTSGKPPVLE